MCVYMYMCVYIYVIKYVECIYIYIYIYIYMHSTYSTHCIHIIYNMSSVFYIYISIVKLCIELIAAIFM